MSATKIYVAAPWARKAEAQAAARQFEEAGFITVSRWLREHDDTTDHILLQKEAFHDIEDIHRADVLVLLNLERSEGKSFEAGIAWTWGTPVIVVGTREGNIFYHLPTMQLARDVEGAISLLKAMEA